MLTLGEAEILRVEEFSQALPLAALGADPALVDAHRSWLEPNFLNAADATFSLVFQCWVVRLDGRVIVIDPCNGNGRERPILTQFHQLDTPFIERFEAAGVQPERVDYVFCTHLHCDHCGWNTRLRDGRWVPTFPNARYLFVRREVERWDPRNNDPQAIGFNVGVFEDSVLPVIEAGLADLVDDHHRIAPALAIEPAYGHTAGHSILRLATEGGELFFTGDAFHHPLQIIDPSLHMTGDSDDLAAAIATRERLRALIADRDALMLPAHFQAPHGGRIQRRDDGGYRFIPFG
jgi:glyoxylase-like metal-dependent hydrolase (beta-lactamase superfamily II)